MLQFARRLGAVRPGPRAVERAVASTPTPEHAPAPAPVLLESVRAPVLPIPAPPMAAPTPAPVLRSSRSRRTPTNAVAPSAPSAGDASLDTPGPAYLLGGPRGSAGVDSASAALFWRSQLSRAEGTALAASHHVEFVRGVYLKALGGCFVPPPGEGSSPKDVKVSGPSPLKKGKGRSVSRNKRKGHAKPVDEDEDASGDGPPSRCKK